MKKEKRGRGPFFSNYDGVNIQSIGTFSALPSHAQPIFLIDFGTILKPLALKKTSEQNQPWKILKMIEIESRQPSKLTHPF